MKKSLIIFVFLGLANLSKSQVFEGVIIYDATYESANPKNVSDSVIRIMFSDADTTALLYLKKNHFRFSTKDSKYDHPHSSSLYVPDSLRLYQWVGNGDEFCASFSVYGEGNPKIKRNVKDTQLILGVECSSITFDYGSRKTIVYYSDKYPVDISPYLNDPYVYFRYMIETQALPLKIIMSGGPALHKLVYTAKEVKTKPIEDSIFVLPKFKFIMKM